MSVICIPLKTAEKMKEAVQKGEINIADLYSMTSDERRNVFGKFASDELAQKINTEFEKAMISKQKKALTSWAEKVFTPAQKKESAYKNVIDRIGELDSLGVLTNQNSESFLHDLVADKLGIGVSQEEAKIISEKANELDALFNQKTEDGIPPVDYWVKRSEMDKYLHSLTPTHQLKVATSIIGRGAMLFSVKSPLTNIISNTVQGAFEGFQRRLSSGTYQGLNNDFALNYVKKVNEIYQKSGYDISRMESISEGQKRLGEEVTHSQGEGAVRAIGRWYEDIVFKQLMGAPDAAAASIAFADSANLATTKIAQDVEKLSGKAAQFRALEIFKDAIQITPKTVEGEIVRSQAIADARYSTYTNKSGYSDLAMAIRTALNNASGDVRLGDQLMPFVKTPANVIQAGVEASGVGFFKGFYKLPEALKRAKEGDRGPMRDVVNSFIRSGLGLTLAVVIAYMFKIDDFVGEYDGLSSKDRNLARIKNAPYNSVKIGDKWISLDYFGPLAPAITGILYARKYGDTLPEKLFQYGRGVVMQAAKLPGLKEFVGLFSSIKDAVSKGSLKKVGEGLTDETISYIRSRTIPAIVNDFAKGIDPNERVTGKSELSKIQASIPGVRENLPEKINELTGKPVKSEGFLSTLLFGNRVKTANESKVISEIDRLYGKGEEPSIGSIEFFGRAKKLNEQIGNKKFNEALKFYGEIYGKQAYGLVSGGAYQKMTDENKKKELNKIRDDALEAMLLRFHYKKSIK